MKNYENIINDWVKSAEKKALVVVGGADIKGSLEGHGFCQYPTADTFNHFIEETDVVLFENPTPKQLAIAKFLTTEPTIIINKKYKTPYTIPNHLRVVIHFTNGDPIRELMERRCIILNTES